MTIATVTAKGQITIPKSVRDALGVGPGDRIDFVLMDDGHFAVVPATMPVKRLKGFLAKSRKPVSLQDMDKAILHGARAVR